VLCHFSLPIALRRSHYSERSDQTIAIQIIRVTMTMTMMTAFDVPSYLEELSNTIQKLPLPAIDRLVRVFLEAYDNGRTIFLFGNGGSAALASHMACDLGKGTAPAAGKRLHAVALTDNVALITAWANDTRYEDIFAEQLENLLHPGDVAFAISASGNSPNMLAALSFARQAGATTAGITGFQGGKMKPLCDVCVVVPSDNMQIIEDLHLSVAHAVFRVVRHEIQESNETGAAMALTIPVP
jgi:D-sedoheptulose 7-phosphate isomerase